MKNVHFADLVHMQAQKYGEKVALHFKDEKLNRWIPISWKRLSEQVKTIAKALFEIGVKEHENLGIFSQNKPEGIILDFAAFANRAVTVPMYATSSSEQIAYIINDAEIAVLFVGEQVQYDVAYEVLKQSKYLKKIVVFDENVKTNGEENTMYFTDIMAIGQKSTAHFEIDARQTDASEDDLATIMYTSGTTGNPKGAMIPHSCYQEAMRIHDIRLTSVSQKDSSLAFLPLSHIFERAWTYFCLYKAIEVYINLRPQEIQQSVKEVRPTLMCSVPRFWEKVYDGVKENIANFSPLKQGIVTWAIAVGKKYNLDYLRLGRTPHLSLKLRYLIADKLIFSKVKKTIGIENGNMYPTAGAKLSDEINEFFRSIGVPIIYGYGLTETTATVTCFNYTHYNIGTVGEIMPDIQVKIGEDNELLVKAKTVFKGYYKKPEATAAAFTADGWFRTGDAGKVHDNQIVLTERIKDLFKTSNGKYIAPQQIESIISVDKYIDQIAVVGDERNYVTAIIVPAIEKLKEYAAKEKIQYADIDELLSLSSIKSFYKERIDNLQKGLAEFEKIKRFSFIKKGFTLEAGEMTNTLKLRRVVILQKYKDLIDEMYTRKED